MTPIPELNDLIATVGDRSPTGTELDKLRAAAEVAKEVGRVGEDLVTHFVDQARAEGASWADIGDVLGVSRQGAHQRHADRPRPERWWRADMGRFTLRAREAVIAAVTAAKDAGNTFIGSEHLLLGVLSVDGNLGNQALERCGLDLEALATATRARLVPAGQEPTEEISRPFGRGRGRPGGRGDHEHGEHRGEGDPPGRGGRGGRRGRGGPPWAQGADADRAEADGGRRRGPFGRLPFTSSGRRVFDLTLGAALELEHNYIGCEHITIALARCGGVASEVIAAAGVTADQVADAVEAVTTELQAAKGGDA